MTHFLLVNLIASIQLLRESVTEDQAFLLEHLSLLDLACVLLEHWEAGGARLSLEHIFKVGSVCGGSRLLVDLLGLVVLELHARGRLEVGMDVLDGHDSLQFDLLDASWVLRGQRTQVTRDALLVLLQVLVDRLQVLDAVALPRTFHVALDDLESTLLQKAIFLHLVLLLHSQLRAVMLVEHRDVPSLLDL